MLQGAIRGLYRTGRMSPLQIGPRCVDCINAGVFGSSHYFYSYSFVTPMNMGQLLAPAEGCGLQLRFICAKQTYYYVLAHFTPFLVFNSHLINF